MAARDEGRLCERKINSRFGLSDAVTWPVLLAASMAHVTRVLIGVLFGFWPASCGYWESDSPAGLCGNLAGKWTA